MIGLLIFLAAWVALVAVCIWADRKDERAHTAWFESPDRIWNQWQHRADDEQHDTKEDDRG